MQFCFLIVQSAGKVIESGPILGFLLFLLYLKDMYELVQYKNFGLYKSFYEAKWLDVKFQLFIFLYYISSY